MAEPEDAVLPILKGIQKDLSDFRREADTRFADIASSLMANGDKLDTIESYVTYHMGVTLQHRHDIESLPADIKTSKRESQRSREGHDSLISTPSWERAAS